MKDLKCLRCHDTYEPVLRIKDSKVFCLNCESLEVKKDLDLIEVIASTGERKDKLKLLNKIDNIDNIGHFFLNLLVYQDKISEEFFNLGFYPVEYIRKWVYSQYLLDIIFADKISNHFLRDLESQKEEKGIFSSRLKELIILAEKAYSYDRYFEELQNGKIVHIDEGSSIELYLTREKFLFATPSDIFESIISKNPFYYKDYLMDCKGYSPNILINVDPIMQEWSLSAKIFTDIAKYTSIFPFNINQLKNPEISAQILKTHAV